MRVRETILLDVLPTIDKCSHICMLAHSLSVSLFFSSILRSMDDVPILSLFHMEQQLQSRSKGTKLVLGTIVHATICRICVSILHCRTHHKECIESMESTPVQESHSCCATIGIYFPIRIAYYAILYSHALYHSRGGRDEQ
jgi:hypothetical protein